MPTPVTKLSHTCLAVLVAVAGVTLTPHNTLAQTPDIHKAASAGDVSKLISILDAGADIGLKDKSGNTALHYAAGAEDVRAVKLLIARGADVNAANPERTMPLHYAIYYGRIGIIEYLIAHGAILDAPHPDGRPSDLAEKVKRHEASRLLLAYQNPPSDSPGMIRLAQERLAALGFDVGTIGERIGPVTLRAANLFQQKHHYPVEPEMTARTIAQIAVEAPQTSNPPELAAAVLRVAKNEFSDICGTAELRSSESGRYDPDLLGVFIKADIGCVSGPSRFSIGGNYRGFLMRQDAIGQWHTQIVGKGSQR